MKWQRVARLALIVVALATIAGVVLTMRKRQAPASAVGVVREDRKAVAESAGGRMTQATGMRIPGFIDYERQFAYEDGSLRFVKPTLTTTRSGRDFTLKGTEATIGPNQEHIAVNGDVVLTASDGLRATTDEATYSNGEQIVRVPGQIEFSRGRMRGSGVGMTYDQRRDVMWLLDKARIQVAPDKGKDPGLRLESGAAGLARRENYVRFDRGFTARRDAMTMNADAAMAYLSDDEERLESLELRGNSRIVMNDAVDGGLQSMQAKEINLDYADDGESLERAVLAGGGAIQLMGTAGQPGRRIAGETIAIDVGPGGDVTGILARDKVRFVVPASGETPERVITSVSMRAEGEAGEGLTSAQFSRDVEFTEQGKGTPARVARSRTLSVVLGAGGSVDDAQFAGGTEFEDGETKARSLDARYLISQGRLLLTGEVKQQPPQVRDARIAVTATSIALTFEGPKMKATGAVQSVSQPAPRPDEQKPAAAHVPGLLEDDQPANVTAAALDYDGGAATATYTGGARLWQKDTAINADTITVDEKTGNLTASGQVRTSMPFEQLDTKTNTPRKVTSIATSKDMHYEDAARRATYTTNAHVFGPQGDLTAQKVEMYMVEGGGALERVEGYKDVVLKADDRTAVGERMTYFAADEKYLMTGPSVSIDEPKECRKTTGKSLTFWRSTDRLLVDGNEEKRTQTLDGGTCGQAAPK
jgi:LPS export ABC transporter protein LptC